MSTNRRTAEQRYERWAKLQPNGCILWTMAPSAGGYRAICIDGKQYRMHRFVYEKFYGKIPEGLQLDHLCRNKACINVEHLEAVTATVNVRRKPLGTPSRKLTEHDVLCIRDMLKLGFSQREIAKKFNVGQTSISCINTRKNWKM